MPGYPHPLEFRHSAVPARRGEASKAVSWQHGKRFNKIRAFLVNTREFQQRVAAAAPNKGHLALGKLAKAKPGYLTIRQYSYFKMYRFIKTHWPSLNQLVPLHGSLFSSKCFNEACSYFESYSWTDTLASSVSFVFDLSKQLCLNQLLTSNTFPTHLYARCATPPMYAQV